MPLVRGRRYFECCAWKQSTVQINAPLFSSQNSLARAGDAIDANRTSVLVLHECGERIHALVFGNLRVWAPDTPDAMQMTD